MKAIITALLVVLVFSAMGNFALGNTRSYSFSATISPDEVTIGQLVLYTVTITNTGNSTMGSATISIPSGFAVSPDVSIISPSGWNFILGSNSINLTSATGAATIDQGETLTFSFSSVASSAIGITTWTANAWSGMGWSGTALSLEGTQPTVTVNSVLTQPTISATPNIVDQGQLSLISQVVSASGGTLPYTYQWLESFDGATYSPIAGANQPSYTFATTTSTAVGTWGFELSVTDSSSIPLTTTSTPVFVTVNSALAAPLVTAVPNALLQSQTSVLSSSSITTGTAPFSYQWYQKAPGSDYTIVGDNSPSYTFPGSTTIGTWAFLLEVTDSAAVSINSSEVQVSVSSTPIYTISVTQSNYGTISPGTTSVILGGSQTFTITPDVGYHVADVLVNGVSVGATTSYTFSNVAADSNIVATFEINQFDITASAGSYGSISPLGTVTVDWDATQSFTITPDANYHIVDVTVDGVSVGPVSSYTFTQVESDHSITATFDINPSGNSYFIYVSSPYGSPIPSTQVNFGDSLTVSVTSPEGNSSHQWVCSGYSIDGGALVPGLSYTFVNIQANHTITFSWQEQYYLTVVSTYSSATGAGWYNAGSIATVSLAAGNVSGSTGTRYVFSGWSGDAAGTAYAGSSDITMDSAKTATANWQTQFYLTVTSVNGGASGQGWYGSGSSANIAATQIIDNATGIRYAFEAWSGAGDGSYTGSTITATVTMNAPITEAASWKTQYLVTYTLTGNVLSVTPPADEWVDSGAPAIAAFPQSITNVAGNTKCIFISDNRPTAITGPTTVKGSYQTSFAVKFSQSGISPDSKETIVTVLGEPKLYDQLINVTWINSGSSVVFAFSNKITGSNSSEQYVLTGTNASSPLVINEPITIQGDYKLAVASTATSNMPLILLGVIALAAGGFGGIMLVSRRKKWKQIKPIINEGGHISPSTPQKIKQGGQSEIFIIAANSGYEIGDVVIDKTTHLGPVRTYKFSGVTQNHTIMAIFNKIAKEPTKMT